MAQDDLANGDPARQAVAYYILGGDRVLSQTLRAIVKPLRTMRPAVKAYTSRNSASPKPARALAEQPSWLRISVSIRLLLFMASPGLPAPESAGSRLMGVEIGTKFHNSINGNKVGTKLEEVNSPAE